MMPVKESLIITHTSLTQPFEEPLISGTGQASLHFPSKIWWNMESVRYDRAGMFNIEEESVSQFLFKTSYVLA